jgi:2-aminoethylphosphonate-pyruvate transaminase
LKYCIKMSKDILLFTGLILLFSYFALYNGKDEKLLFTPGPLSTTYQVRKESMRDLGSREPEMIQIIQEIRMELLRLIEFDKRVFSTVLFPGSGTYSLESVLSSFPFEKTVLLLSNGAYGQRLKEILSRYRVNHICLCFDENEKYDYEKIKNVLETQQISDIIMVQSETSTGRLNDIHKVIKLVNNTDIKLIVDAMSSFPFYLNTTDIQSIRFIVSSSNKCLQGLPGISFIIGQIESLKQSKNQAKTYALDLYRQWNGLETTGQFLYTPPTTILMAMREAIREIQKEGVEQRLNRYMGNAMYITEKMNQLNFTSYLNETSPVISTFYLNGKNFTKLYEFLLDKNIVIYPGKTTKDETFRIGTIGNLHRRDFYRLVNQMKIFLNKV